MLYIYSKYHLNGFSICILFQYFLCVKYNLRTNIITEIRLYSLQPKILELYTVTKNKTRSWLRLRSWTPYCQIQGEIEESGENHDTFGYCINQIPYDYTVEMRNWFKGIDLTESVSDETGRKEESRPSPKKRNAKKHNGCLRRLNK